MSQFNYGYIITNFRDKSKEESQSKIEWIRTHEPLKIKQSMIILNKIYREIEK